MSRNLPIFTGSENSLSQYLQEIKRIPSLSVEEEQRLARLFLEEKDIKAAQTLVKSHLKLVVKIAGRYKGYGLPMVEMISEGNIGLLHSVKRFKPEMGFRLATYAMWWIKAAIQDYILRSWSIVRIGSSAMQKKLFFNLRKLKNKIEGVEKGIGNTTLTQISKQLDVPLSEVEEMNVRLYGGDVSLNNPIGFSDGEKSELIELVADNSPSQEQLVLHNQEYQYRLTLFKNALKILTERELEIIKARKLKENPTTLEELSKLHSISRERVRQIEERAMQKLISYVSESQKLIANS